MLRFPRSPARASIRRHPRACARSGCWLGANALAAFDKQAVAVEGVDAAARLRFAQAFFLHGGDQQIDDADARRSRAEHGDGLLAERDSGGVDGGEQSCRGDGRGALNVVVEGAEAVAIALEQARRIGAGEVLPLQKNVRPAALDGADEGLDEIVVLLAADALVLPADVDGIVEQRLVVGADVEQHGQAMLGGNAAERRVERHFADGNAHAARALIAEAEDAFAVADHDAAHRRRSADWRGSARCGPCWDS